MNLDFNIVSADALPDGTAKKAKKERKLESQRAVNEAVKGVCDVLRRSNCAGPLQYVPELTWLLFLRILDEREEHEAEMAEALGTAFQPSLEAPYRWRDWAAPKGPHRRKLDEKGGALMAFVNEELLPHLRSFAADSGATPRQKVIAEVVSGTERTRVDTETNLKDVLDRVHAISARSIDTQHVFPIQQVYEGLLLDMGDQGSAGGQFYTPREVIRAIVRVLDPALDATVYDPCCGTGGFLAEAFEYLHEKWKAENTSPTQLDRLKTEAFFGREKDNLAYPIGLANLVLHGIDVPRIWHGNTLTGDPTYEDLFRHEDAEEPGPFDVILSNPPFGGKEGEAAQSRFPYKTSATQVLFVQHFLENLKDGGRAGFVIDEGVLFRTNEGAFVKTKKKMLSEADVFCIVSLPGGVFSAAGAGVKTNLVFLRKGQPTERIWYYDLSGVKVTKTKPLTLVHFDEFFRLLPHRGTPEADSERSWTVDLKARRERAKEQADPLRQQAQAPAAEAARLADQLKDMRRALKADPTLAASITEIEARQKEREQEAKRLIDRAQTIEDGVYDLKAVNPHAVEELDERAPEELLDTIEALGREVASALAALRARSGFEASPVDKLGVDEIEEQGNRPTE